MSQEAERLFAPVCCGGSNLFLSSDQSLRISTADFHHLGVPGFEWIANTANSWPLPAGEAHLRSPPCILVRY